jgi:hypothetical protein
MATTRTVYIDTDNGPGTTYTTMDAMEDAWAGVANSGDCVGEDEEVQAWCRCTGGTEDTAVVDFTGWTSTDADHTVTVEVEADYMHNGEWVTSGNIYRGNRTGGNTAIQIRMNYVRCIGLMERNRTLEYKGTFEVRGQAEDVRLINCLAYEISGAATNVYGFYLHLITGSTKATMVNCFAYGFAGTGSKGFLITTNTNHDTYAYYCAAVDCLVGFNSGGSTTQTHAKNCFTFDTTTAYEDVRWGASFNCCYDNGSGIGTDPIDVSGMAGTDLFEDYASAVYRIQSGSPIFRLGKDLRTDAVEPVLLDYKGETRDAQPTPYFDEYPAPLDPGPTAYEQMQDHISHWSLDAVRKLNTYHPTS